MAALFAFVLLSSVYQVWTVLNFINAGPRFTLADGQLLCARIIRLEAYHGFTPGNCEFGESK